MFFSNLYKQEMEKANRPRCIHVNPQMAEYVMGYPVDWTSRSTSPTTATIPEHPTACFTGGSLFAGVGGLDLGLQKVVVTKMYCEIDPAAADVLQRRMDDGFLHRGEIHPDVCHIPKEALSGIEFLFGGFPCPDIAISGAKAGFGGVRSALFAHLIIAAAKGDPVIMFLENVANILAADMVGVFTEVLRWLLMINFTKIQWGVISASNVGSPQCRRRWYCLASRPEADLDRLRSLMPYDADTLEDMPNKEWNAANVVPVSSWLNSTTNPEDKERLNQMGNAMVPQCAETALRILAHFV